MNKLKVFVIKKVDKIQRNTRKVQVSMSKIFRGRVVHYKVDVLIN